MVTDLYVMIGSIRGKVETSNWSRAWKRRVLEYPLGPHSLKSFWS